MTAASISASSTPRAAWWGEWVRRCPGITKVGRESQEISCITISSPDSIRRRGSRRSRSGSTRKSVKRSRWVHRTSKVSVWLKRDIRSIKRPPNSGERERGYPTVLSKQSSVAAGNSILQRLNLFFTKSKSCFAGQQLAPLDRGTSTFLPLAPASAPTVTELNRIIPFLFPRLLIYSTSTSHNQWLKIRKILFCLLSRTFHFIHVKNKSLYKLSLNFPGLNNFLLMIGYQPPLTDILVTEIPTGENSPKVTGNFSEKPFSNWNIILLNVVWRRSCRDILEILRSCVSPSAVSRPLINPSWSTSHFSRPPHREGGAGPGAQEIQTGEHQQSVRGHRVRETIHHPSQTH